MAREPLTADTYVEEYATVTFDLSTLTLGEAAVAEAQSGLSVQEMMKSPMARKTLAILVHELRHSEQPRSWSQLSNLRLLDVSSSIQRSLSDGASEKSNGSPSEMPST